MCASSFVRLVCASSFEFLRTFFRIFVMFVNEKVCEIALIISGSTDNEFSTDNFIELSMSSHDVFTIIMGCF